MRSFPIVVSGRPQRSAKTSRGRGASNSRTRSNVLLDEDPKMVASTNTFVAGARITRDQVVVTAPAWPLSRQMLAIADLVRSSQTLFIS